MYTDMWAIMDNNGIIEQSTEEEIMSKWDDIFRIGADFNYTGDLKLIQIKDICN